MNVQDLTIMLICGQRRLLSVVNLTIFADKRSPERDFIPILLVVNKQRIHEPYTLPWCAQWVLKHMRTSSLLMRPGVFQHTIALDHTFLLPQPYGFYIFLRESTTVPAIALPLWVTQRMVRYLKLLFEVRFGIGPICFLSVCLWMMLDVEALLECEDSIKQKPYKCLYRPQRFPSQISLECTLNLDSFETSSPPPIDSAPDAWKISLGKKMETHVHHHLINRFECNDNHVQSSRPFQIFNIISTELC